MISVNNEEKCSGCTACESICKNKAISFVRNSHGFLMPIVNSNKCINCGLCDIVCPLLKKQDMLKNKVEFSKKAYAFICHDNDERVRSTSGGFFPSISRYIINEGGYVCGCILDKFVVRHVVTNDWNIIKMMQGSKYVQSDMNSCFNTVAEKLILGKIILFTGTSCQVAGLKAFLRLKNISDENILFVDFFCHGVPSPLIWEEYIKFYKRKKRRDIVDYKFRSKRYGWGESSFGGDFLSYMIINNNLIDEWSYLSRLWRYIFFSDLCIRKNCYVCMFSSINKPSDITMADFWGIEIIDKSFDDGRGCSLLVEHSEKGMQYIRHCKNQKIMEVDLKLAIKKQANAFRPSVENFKSEDYWEDYKRKGFDYTMKKYFNYTISGKIKALIKRVLFQMKMRFLF